MRYNKNKYHFFPRYLGYLFYIFVVSVDSKCNLVKFMGESFQD